MRAVPTQAILLFVAAVAAVSCGDGITPPRPAGPPAAMEIIAGQAQEGVVGTELPQPLRVRVVDAEGIPVAGQVVNFVIVNGGGRAFAGVAITTDSGIAVERWTLGTSTALADSQRLEARAINPNTGERLVFGIFRAVALPDVPATVTKSGGDAQQAVAGTAIADSVEARVLDRYGNPVPGVTITWSAEWGGSVSPTSSTSNSDGRARTQWTLGTAAGLQLVTASVAGATAAQFLATASAGAATQVAASAGSTSGTVGSAVAIAPAVTVRDLNGNPVAGVNVTFAVESGGGSVVGATQTTNAIGVAQAGSWTLGTTAGANSLTAVAAGLTGSPVTFTAMANPGPAATVVLTTQPTTTPRNRVVFPVQPVAQLHDAFGNAVAQAGTTITAAITTGEGSLSGTTAITTNGSGSVTFDDLAIIGTVGARTLSFSATGLTAGTVNVTLAAGAPTAISVAAGDTQTTFFSTEVGTPPSVKVADPEGNVVAGVAVTFAVTGGGGSITGAGATTNASGIARVGSWTVGASPGTNTLNATSSAVPGASATATALSIQFQSISAGRSNACGLATTGAAYCWGGQDFHFSDYPSLPMQQVPVLVGGGLTFTAVVAGEWRSCGLVGTGDAYCWGNNRSSQLGDGTTALALLPVAVAGGHKFVSVYPGSNFSCGLTPAGAAYCWGVNFSGNMGFAASGTYPTPVAAGGGLTFTSLSVGSAHACGLTAAAEVYCWGSNTYGQLGVGTTGESVSTPTKVGGAEFTRLAQHGFTITQVVASERHSCGRASNGEAFCWGNGQFGKLGNGDQSSRSEPTLVSGNLSFERLTLGGEHSCGLTAAGVAYCWGYNVDGRSGFGAANESTSPMAVDGALTFAQIDAATSFASCGLTTARVAYCWGRNDYGTLGNPSAGSISRSPVVVRMY